ncbi:MAG: prepilin peptidase [Candidatus Baltobacteraceae bacterium]
MEASASWLVWVVLVGCLFATITDLASRKIPNPITVAILMAAIAAHGWHGIVPLLHSFGAMTLVFVPGTFAHSRGWLGGGDVKLAAAVAAAFSFPLALAFVLYTMLCGGVLALVWIAFARHRQFLTELKGYLISINLGVIPTIDTTGTRKLPYALAIACGALLAYGSQTAMPYLQLKLFS